MFLPSDSAADCVPVAALEALFETAPESSRMTIELIWRGGILVTGSLEPFVEQGTSLGLNLLDTLRLVAMSTGSDVELIPRLVDAATDVRTADRGQLYPAATYALAKPATLRWITANAARVAGSENWRSGWVRSHPSSRTHTTTEALPLVMSQPSGAWI